LIALLLVLIALLLAGVLRGTPGMISLGSLAVLCQSRLTAGAGGAAWPGVKLLGSPGAQSSSLGIPLGENRHLIGHAPKCRAELDF
jgi:hypothetical protein